MKSTGNDDKTWKNRAFYKQQTKILGLGGCLQPNNSYKPRPCTILCVKFNGEIDNVEFIFTRCVAYSLDQKLYLYNK